MEEMMKMRFSLFSKWTMEEFFATECSSKNRKIDRYFVVDETRTFGILFASICRIQFNLFAVEYPKTQMASGRERLNEFWQNYIEMKLQHKRIQNTERWKKMFRTRPANND